MKNFSDRKPVRYEITYNNNTIMYTDFNQANCMFESLCANSDYNNSLIQFLEISVLREKLSETMNNIINK